jgi:hypothetical protein
MCPTVIRALAGGWALVPNAAEVITYGAAADATLPARKRRRVIGRVVMGNSLLRKTKVNQCMAE